MILAVPKGDPFFDNYTVISGFDTKTGVDGSDFPEREYGSEQVAGKTIKNKFKLVEIWMPVDDLTQFENKSYEKGTYQAQQEMYNAKEQQKKNVWNTATTASTLN